MSTRIIFMGSPDFAVPILEGLSNQYEIVAVVTQPDKPSGRGRLIAPPPVKVLATKLGLLLMQPVKLNEPAVFSELLKLKPDLIVLAAYGKIIRQNVLDLPKFGCINVHASILPRWRGASPIQAAIAAGDKESGVTIMKMDAGLDTGPILAQERLLLDHHETGTTLSRKLSILGKELLLKSIPEYLNGKISPIAQVETLATHAPLLKKEDGLLDFTLPVEILERKIRAYQPWPGTFFYWKENQIKVLAGDCDWASEHKPGALRIVGNQPGIGCPNGTLILREIQPAGKKPMTGTAFLAGAKNWLNTD